MSRRNPAATAATRPCPTTPEDPLMVRVPQRSSSAGAKKAREVAEQIVTFFAQQQDQGQDQDTDQDADSTKTASSSSPRTPPIVP